MKIRKLIVNVVAPLASIAVCSVAHLGCGAGTSEPVPPVVGTSEAIATPPVPAADATPGPSVAGSACTMPTSVNGQSAEELAWRIFVAASCSPSPSTPGGPSLAWETWTEQQNLGPVVAGVQKRKPHASRLALTKQKASTAPPTPDGVSCSPMTQPPVAHAPTNLTSTACFAEEVFANPAEVAYITRPAPNSLLTLAGQAGAGTISFPAESVEIKADWVAASSFTNATFKCDGSTTDVYTESFNGTCYALAAMHVSSKLFPNWLWATFEPQYPITNPNRCDPSLFSGCTDGWGSIPPVVEKTGNTPAVSQQTPVLTALMNQAKLSRAFYNYRLTGVQWDYETNKYLGNSFVEFNAGVGPRQASCITCHSFAAMSKTSPYGGVQGAFGDMAPWVGLFPAVPTTPAPASAPYFTQDRSYLLDSMGPKGTPVN
jgi:hypothetical protein